MALLQPPVVVAPASDDVVARLDEDLRAAVRRDGLDPQREVAAVRRLASGLVREHDERSLTGVVAPVADPDALVAELVARVAGVGELDFMSGFKGVLMTCFGPTAIPTGAPQLDELVATRGMAGMLNTVWLIICAMCFGGVMTGSGMLRSLTSIFLRWVRRAFSAVASTVGAGLFFNLCTADQYISIILSGRLFRDLYADRGLEPRLLSRSVEDSATVCSVLIPWNSCGMTQATVLGVSTFVYAPYCIFNIVSPLMSLLVAAVGWNIKRKK